MVIVEGQRAHWTRSIFFYFPANGSTNPDVFYLKTICSPRGIKSQNFCSLELTVLEELGNKQTDKLTHSLTFYCFYRVIFLFLNNNISTISIYNLKYCY